MRGEDKRAFGNENDNDNYNENEGRKRRTETKTITITKTLARTIINRKSFSDLFIL